MENQEEILRDYVKVSTYAKRIEKSVTWVYKLIERDKLTLLEVDGVKFVKEKE